MQLNKYENLPRVPKGRSANNSRVPCRERESDGTIFSNFYIMEDPGIPAAVAATPGRNKGRNETPVAVSLVSYKEGSSDSELDQEEEEEYVVPRKRARLARDKQGIRTCTHSSYNV